MAAERAVTPSDIYSPKSWIDEISSPMMHSTIYTAFALALRDVSKNTSGLTDLLSSIKKKSPAVRGYGAAFLKKKAFGRGHEYAAKGKYLTKIRKKMKIYQQVYFHIINFSFPNYLKASFCNGQPRRHAA